MMFKSKQRISELEWQVERLIVAVDELREENRGLRERTSIKTGEREVIIGGGIYGIPFQFGARPEYTPINKVVELICEKLNIEFEHVPAKSTEATVVIKKKDRTRGSEPNK